MRNLIAFFSRFKIFMVLAILQSIALYFYFSYTEFPKLQLLTTTASVNANILESRNELTKQLNLPKTNRKLMWENRYLRKKLKESNYLLRHKKTLISDTTFKQQYDYIVADVINNTYDKRDNYMTINAGWKEGVQRGLGVISSKGVVGIVHIVSKHYALVKTVLSKNINIDIMLQKNGAFGLLKWDGLDPKNASMAGVSNDISVKKWSKVITRGGSGIFPKGITVGKVRKLKYIEGKPLWDINIRLAEDFRTIQHVYIVKNLMIEEFKNLEKQIPEDKVENDING